MLSQVLPNLNGKGRRAGRQAMHAHNTSSLAIPQNDSHNPPTSPQTGRTLRQKDHSLLPLSWGDLRKERGKERYKTDITDITERQEVGSGQTCSNTYHRIRVRVRVRAGAGARVRVRE